MLGTLLSSIDYLNGLNILSKTRTITPPSTNDFKAIINNEKLMSPVLKISKLLNSFGD